MKFQMYHENYNVKDLEASLKFYEEALGLTEQRRIEAEDGSFIIAYLGNDTTDFLLELTWLKEHPRLTTWESVNFIWHSGQRIMRRLMRFMRRWAVLCLKIRLWESILSRIRTATGWRSCRREIKPPAENRREGERLRYFSLSRLLFFGLQTFSK